MAYTPEEIEQFRKKDKRISIQGILQVILAKDGAKVSEVEANVKLAKAYSDEIEEIVNENGGVKEVTTRPTPAESDSLPAPTADQKKVLDAICTQLKGLDTQMDWDDVCRNVLQYSTEVAGKSSPQYPINILAVEPIVKWLKGN
jgi:hypothetical protein